MKRFPLRLALFAAFVAAAPLAAAESNDFFFKKGDRIVFLGDSITEQYQYSTDIELYLTTRFPEFDGTPAPAFEFSSGSFGSHPSLYARSVK